MAASLSTCFHPITVVSNNRNNSRIKASSSSSSSKWWIPLFGWSSSDPDYIHGPTDGSGTSDPDHANRSRFAPGCFTEEKAKQLRMKTTETANFHDIMYHSAIASRLASDLSGRSRILEQYIVSSKEKKKIRSEGIFS